MNNANKNILIIDDNQTVCLMLKSWLVKKDFSVETASNVKMAKQMVRTRPFDLILTDIRMPDADGFNFLSWVKRYDSDILVVMMTGFADIESAVESIKSGAVDFISKPIEPEQLFKKIDDAFIQQENESKGIHFTDSFIRFPQKEYEQLYSQFDQIAESGNHWVIIGDRGTGKHSAVKYIYEKGFPASKPLVTFDLGKSTRAGGFNHSLQNEMTNASLLGEKFNDAKGGLLHIPKLGRLNINYQNELLNILTRQKKNDDYTQVIMSTEMGKECLQKHLIPKLYKLIEPNCVVLLTIRGKKKVILFLAARFLEFANSILNKEIVTIDSVIQEQLLGYSWPGNIQELKNSIFKAASLTDGPNIPASIAPELFGNKEKNKSRSHRLNPIHGLRKENYEKEKILEALELAKGNKTMAASILNIDRKTLYNKIKLYNVPIQN